jgi:predicted glycoside hydrolase/deacetylase ChbG (UPF0249 family)
MLLVNADDYGRNREATDRILECLGHRRVNAASAMVFMEDSERAACVARAARHALGLHLNFSESFTAAMVPAAIRQDHERIRRFVLKSKYALVLFHPGLAGAFRRVFAAQLHEFRRLYGTAPTHFDGHQHYHLATNVLVQRLLPLGTRVRRSFSFREGEKSALNLWYRRMVDASLCKRHVLTDFFFSAEQHLSVERMERVVMLARTANVELMVHPEIARERDFLLGKEFERLMSAVHVGGRGDLTHGAAASRERLAR